MLAPPVDVVTTSTTTDNHHDISVPLKHGWLFYPQYQIPFSKISVEKIFHGVKVCVGRNSLFENDPGSWVDQTM